MKRLLILSCSKRKLTDEKLLPAIERYDGPNFRLLRRYLKFSAEDLEIYILSAKFGLIKHTTTIPFYEQKITTLKIEEIKQTICFQSEKLFDNDCQRKSLLINLGKDYWQLFGFPFESFPTYAETSICSGSSGKRLAEMYDWLYGKESSLRNEQPKIKLEKEVFIQGIRLNTTEREIRAIVKDEISQNGMKNLQNYQSWFVLIEDLKISPKWLISRLTNLSVGKFHSDQARKVLQKLGMKVQRV